MVFAVGGQKVEWQYDVVTLKIEFDAIESLDADARITALIDCFKRHGMPVCDPQVALRVYSLVKMQFDRLALSIAQQVQSLGEDE